MDERRASDVIHELLLHPQVSSEQYSSEKIAFESLSISAPYRMCLIPNDFCCFRPRRLLRPLKRRFYECNSRHTKTDRYIDALPRHRLRPLTALLVPHRDPSKKFSRAHLMLLLEEKRKRSFRNEDITHTGLISCQMRVWREMSQFTDYRACYLCWKNLESGILNPLNEASRGNGGHA